MFVSILDDRRRGAEEAFFAKQNEALRVQLRATGPAETARTQVAAASGIRDGAVLAALESLNVGPEGAAALSLIPLVAVAWADGDVSSAERDALLSAATDAGLAKDSPAYGLFAGWLDTKPSGLLLSRWEDYAASMSASMAVGERAAFRAELLDRARAVATAAGGFLGFGRVSASEEAVLGRIEAALAGEFSRVGADVNVS